MLIADRGAQRSAATDSPHGSSTKWCLSALHGNQSIFLRVRRSGTIDAMAAFEMTRIDLRNRALSAAQLRAALPRGGVDVETVLPTVRPVVEAVAQRGAEAALEYGESFDGVRPATVRVRADRLDDGARRAGVRRPGRAGGRDRPGQGRARRSAPHRHDDDARSRRDGHRTLGAGGAGRAVRAGRQRGLPVERGDERRAGPDRGRRIPGDRQPAAQRSSTVCRIRRSWPPRGCSVSTKCGRSAVRRASRCWRTAAPTPTAPSWHRST